MSDSKFFSTNASIPSNVNRPNTRTTSSTVSVHNFKQAADKRTKERIAKSTLEKASRLGW